MGTYAASTGTISNMSLWVNYMLKEMSDKIDYYTSSDATAKKKIKVSVGHKRQANPHAEATYIVTDYKVNKTQLYGDFEIRLYDRDHNFVCFMTDELMRVFEEASQDAFVYQGNNRYAVFANQLQYFSVDVNDENDFVAVLGIRVYDQFVTDNSYLSRFVVSNDGDPFN